jgi:hypothetical protein
MRQCCLFLIIFSVLCFSACDSAEKKSNEKYYLPDAGGELGEMLVVMDSAKWSGALGKSIKGTFAASVPGLPQDEPFYALKPILPSKFNSVLRSAKNILIVLSLEGNSKESKEVRKEFSQESLQRIESDTALFMVSRQDENAKGQEIVYLFAKDDATLINHINNNSARLLNHFNKIEAKRTAEKIFASTSKGVMEKLKNDHKFSIKIPFGYEMPINGKNFVWLRYWDQEYEKNIFIHYVPYTSDEIFKSKDMVPFREGITETYIRDIEKPQIYLTFQPEMPFVVTEVNFNNKFALETRGLWKLSDSSAGGPFLSYTFADEKSNRLYYIEGYAYAPSMDKYKFIHELSTILWTFESEVSSSSN